MTEQAISAAAQIAAPVVTALLEDLHQAASTEIALLEATLPDRITAAEVSVQNWVNHATAAFHGLIARIDGARGNVTAVAGPVAVPAPAPTATPAPAAAPKA